MKRAIVVGATSGIGRQVALLLADSDYLVGATGRRKEKLEQLKSERPGTIITADFDVTTTYHVAEKLEKLQVRLGGLDLLVISSGVGDVNKELDFTIEKKTIDVNVTGFTEVADWAFTFFANQAFGHLVAITSIAGLRGNASAPAYNATKAFQVNYLEGLQQKAKKLKRPIHVTDIRPGFVDTDMAKGAGQFWVAPVEKAARQIVSAIRDRKPVAYVTKRWALIALVLKIIPKRIYWRL